MGDFVKIKRFLAFMAIVSCLLVYQNCGGYKAISSSNNSANIVIPVEKLGIRSLEMKRYVDDSGDYFQNIRVDISDSGMYIVVDESQICQRSFALGAVDQQRIYDLFSVMSYRNKGSATATENHLITEVKIEDLEGNIESGHIVTDNNQELSLSAGSLILKESLELQTLLNSLIEKDYSGEQSACMTQAEIPRFVEYIWTDVVGGNSIAREAYLFESQNDGNTVFLSLPNSNFCFEAYLLNLHEQAIAIKATSRIILDSSNATPVDTNGVRYIDYHFVNQESDRYYIDPQMAPVNSQILNNGEIITDTMLMVGAMAQARYQSQSEQASDISRCIFN